MNSLDYLARSFKVAEYNFGAHQLRFKYGLHNPDFPAKIKRRSYILDYDCYAQGAFYSNEIQENLTKFNEFIYHFFESSITEELRTHLDSDE